MNPLRHWVELDLDSNICSLTSPILLPKLKDKELKEGEIREEIEEILFSNMYQEKEE